MSSNDSQHDKDFSKFKQERYTWLDITENFFNYLQLLSKCHLRCAHHLNALSHFGHLKLGTSVCLLACARTFRGSLFL